MTKGPPISLQTVELKVRMCCMGCERVVRNAIKKIRGVDSVEVDVALEKVTVIGYVDRNKVLRAVRRSGKRAEFWPTGLPLFYTGPSDYYYDDKAYRETYNYWRHGYNDGERHGRTRSAYRPDDKASTLFNEDNVHACTIM